MNRSYSKIRHIQESNIKLEKRLLKEEDENRRKRIKSAFCGGQNDRLIDYPGSKWDKRPFREYAEQYNVTDEEIIRIAWIDCPKSAKSDNLAPNLKDSSNIQKYEVLTGDVVAGNPIRVDIRRKPGM